MSIIIQNIVLNHAQTKSGGIYSVCSANPFVLEAAMLQAKADHTPLLIEATSNQVDQFGGYTGMTPSDFRSYVQGLARKTDFDLRWLILGGDHLGPNVWQHQAPQQAMAHARRQIAAYVQAGFSKIHLDASMPLKGDSVQEHLPLKASTVARRTAELCAAAEQAAASSKPVYVIGTDVPVPGGAQESLEHLRITPVEEVREILELTKEAFFERHLEDAWQRVLAVVVQPGVEFGDQQIVAYDRTKAQALIEYIENQPPLVYEAHSTDYQSAAALQQMVQDHFAILKVGPALTFAFREAVFALAFIEKELLELHRGWQSSQILETLEQAMLSRPQYWQKHYRGSSAQQAFARRYSLSDRIRYYWPQKEVASALNRLLENLQKTEIPVTLVSQFLPDQAAGWRSGEIQTDPHSLIYHKIRQALTPYALAAGATKSKGTSYQLRTVMENV